MEKKQVTSGLKLEIVTKSLYPGSGPRGIDVYARHLYDELSRVSSKDKVSLAKDKPSHKNVDIIHFTFFDPFFLTLWGRKLFAKYIVTVHDLIPLKFSKHFSVGLRGKFKWILQKHALQSASAIITDSECSKNDITEIAGISKDKIFVVKLAAGHTTVSQKMVRVVKQEYNLPDRYLLYVGDINWNKNIPGLINAFASLDSNQTHLVLVGKAFESGQGTIEYQSIQTAIKNSGKGEFIHVLGFVPSHHLPAIYQGATLYVQPSWYEGFGFPVLEAMQQETPVLSSSAGSLPEVAGTHAYYFDPHNQQSFVAMLKSLLADKAKRERYVESGRVWARSFSWEKVVKDTHAVYEKVLS